MTPPGRYGSDATALRRPHPVVRDRSDVTDRGDREPDGGETAQRALTARTGTLHFDLEGAHAVFGGLLARVVRGDLGGVGSRLAAALEIHHAGAGPADRIALRIGDGDHGVVEAG